MKRLTDRKTAADLESNYKGLRAAGMPRDILTERYIKLAKYEETFRLYICDPQKNTDCPKSFCIINGGLCSCTTQPEFARLDENGRPIEDPDEGFPF